MTESIEETAPKPGRGIAVLAAVCVFFSGAGVMIYEFLAVRILQSYWGSALDVWASEIAVCMAGLALGYGIGGVLVDKFPSWCNVGIALIFAGLTACVTEPIATGVSNWLDKAEVYREWFPLVAAGTCSFLPLLALGTVSPQVIRLTARSIERLGTSAGMIFSISTVGSIAGTLATVPLIRNFGVLEVLLATSAVLAIGGVGLVVFGRTKYAVVAATCLLVFLSVPQAVCAQEEENEVLYQKYSAYHHIIVENVGETRQLRFDNAVQSLMSLKDPQNGGFGYTDFFHVPMVFNPKMERALFLGLGGATGPKAYLHDYPNVKVDVAEIDPEVQNVAEKYFFLPEDERLKVQIQDGRVFLRRSEETYDTIIMDAYASSARGAYLPYHLATREFFQIVRKRLSNGGAIVFNAIGRDGMMNTEVIQGIYATLKDQFEAVYIFEETTSINTVFVGIKVDKDAEKPEKEYPESPYLKHPVTADKLKAMTQEQVDAKTFKRPDLVKKFGLFAPIFYEEPSSEVLTDNHAPVDISGGMR